jgi:hypothetical protein
MRSLSLFHFSGMLKEEIKEIESFIKSQIAITETMEDFQTETSLTTTETSPATKVEFKSSG